MSFRSALFVCAVSTVSAHVRLKNSGLRIRNANNAAADGVYSTNGPCGGSKEFGRNGINELVEGQEIELIPAYNGGHQSRTQNFFKAYVICGRPDDDAELQVGGNRETVPASDGSYPAEGALNTGIDATDSSTVGYPFKILVPGVQDMPDGEYCTIAVADGRDWGGCIDAHITPAIEGVAPPEPTVANLKGVTLEIDATLVETDSVRCIADSPDCMCQDGQLIVQHSTGASTGKVTLNYMQDYAEFALKQGNGAFLVGTGDLKVQVGGTDINPMEVKVISLRDTEEVYVSVTNVDDSPNANAPNYCSAEFTVPMSVAPSVQAAGSKIASSLVAVAIAVFCLL